MANFNLTQEQAKVASHSGAHFRLLAGPGTGKTATLVGRVVRLITEHNVAPERIHILTFTRAATRELRRRIEKKLGKENKNFPSVSTLHSYALSKLLKAGAGVVTLPQPLRIADDWEERYIILEDLRRLRKLKKISQVQDLLNLLSACWHRSMDPDEQIQQTTEEGKFLGEWLRHRQVYGYSLRAELVYQLKLALERRDEFPLGAPQHLLVDEYQDLNRCDLDVIGELRTRGAEVFVSGDDDQSIYGFRMAYPKGIRQFCEEYSGAAEGVLAVCHRCAPNILALGEHVANLDPDRIEKNTRPLSGRPKGEVAILMFRDQDAEAIKIAEICRTLIDNKDVEKPSDILILLRDNWRGHYSKPIADRLKEVDVSVVDADEEKPLNREDGRILLSFMRLAVNANDSLAWRTLFEIWRKGIGPAAFDAVYKRAIDVEHTFTEQIHHAQDLPSRFRKKITEIVAEVKAKLLELFPDGNKKYETNELLMESIQKAADVLIRDLGERELVMSEFARVSKDIDKFTIQDVVSNASGAGEKIEHESDNEESISIMTMHKAKGLTAKAVIVAGAEQERIPGRATGEKEKGDARRLLYVSLTRAESFLFVTYCQQRTGSQGYGGKNTGTAYRDLTEFLHHYRACKPTSGESYTVPRKNSE